MIFKGKLTYCLAAIGVIWGIYQISTGAQDEGIATLWVALGLFGLRRAVS